MSMKRLMRTVKGLTICWYDSDPLADLDETTDTFTADIITHTNPVYRKSAKQIFIDTQSSGVLDKSIPWSITIEAVCNDGKTEYRKPVEVFCPSVKWSNLSDHIGDALEQLIERCNLNHLQTFYFKARVC